MKKTFRSSSLRPLLVSIVAILFGFLVGSILLIASGQNPIQCFIALFKGGLSSKERIFNTFSNAIPLVFTGLSVTFAYKKAFSTSARPARWSRRACSQSSLR